MVYQSLCNYLDKREDASIANLINPGTLSVQKDTLKDTLNTLYDFKKDTVAIANIANFEDYRRHYPIRYEWHHYNSKIALPIV